jgi:hypothetical protein
MPRKKNYGALSGGNDLTKRPPKNVAASVRQKLLNKSRADIRPFHELVQYYAMERFLYRLSLTHHANQFILKGALMLRIWQAPEIRPTMDIDLLGRTNNDISQLTSIVEDILSVEIEPDGLIFFTKQIKVETIAEEAEYQGVRIWFPAKIDTMSLNMQIDIGFGDVVYPEPEKTEIPSMLEFPSPRLLCYSRESLIAEKFEEIVKQVKDFIGPITSSLMSDKSPPSKWSAPGPWV